MTLFSAPNHVALNLDTSAPNSTALNVHWHADSASHPWWHGIQRANLHSAPCYLALRCLNSAPYDLALNKRIIFEISFGISSFVKLVFTKSEIVKICANKGPKQLLIFPLIMNIKTRERSPV